jgi:hypothetical protein
VIEAAFVFRTKRPSTERVALEVGKDVARGQLLAAWALVGVVAFIDLEQVEAAVEHAYEWRGAGHSLLEEENAKLHRCAPTLFELGAA